MVPGTGTGAQDDVHDSLIIRAFHRIVGTSSGTLGERTRAEAQARLPVRLGGMGLSPMGQPTLSGCATGATIWNTRGARAVQWCSWWSIRG